jgi:hypothetical protein
MPSVKEQRTAKARQGRRRGEMYGAPDECLEEHPLCDRQGKSAIEIGKTRAAGKTDGAAAGIAAANKPNIRGPASILVDVRYLKRLGPAPMHLSGLM